MGWDGCSIDDRLQNKWNGNKTSSLTDINHASLCLFGHWMLQKYNHLWRMFLWPTNIILNYGVLWINYHSLSRGLQMSMCFLFLLSLLFPQQAASKKTQKGCFIANLNQRNGHFLTLGPGPLHKTNQQPAQKILSWTAPKAGQKPHKP